MTSRGMLRAGRVVEIDQRHARADLAAENWEIATADQGVEGHGLQERAHERQTFPASAEPDPSGIGGTQYPGSGW